MRLIESRKFSLKKLSSDSSSLRPSKVELGIKRVSVKLLSWFGSPSDIVILGSIFSVTNIMSMRLTLRECVYSLPC